MPENFGDLRSASRLRDIIRRIASNVVDQKRPDVRIGRVHHVDPGRQLAWILYPGESDDNLVKVRVALNMLPTRTIQANGPDADIVRVAGRPGAYYVTDFVRGVPQDPNNIPIVDVNFNNQKGINLADPTDPQDALNLRTADSRYANAATVSGKEPSIAAGTTGQYWRGDKTWQTLDKSAVGLANVDNTSDVNKPLSTAAVNALGLKAPLNSPAFTGTVTGITKAMVGLGNVANVDTTNASNITTGTLPNSVLPPLAINEVFTVASQAAMLALTAQRGDMAIRTDFAPARVFVLSADTPSVLSAWVEITAAGSVTSVAGKAGVVSLVKADVGLGNVDNTSDVNKPVSTATQTALNLKADDSGVVHKTGTEVITGSKSFDVPVGMKLQAASPAAPSSGYNRLYFKQNGRLYVRTPGGEVLIPYGEELGALHSNPDFEDAGTIGSAPPSWSDFWGRSSVRYAALDNTVYLTGSQSVRMNIDSGSSSILSSSIFPVQAGQILTVSYNAFSDNAAGRLRAEIAFNDNVNDPVYFAPGVNFEYDNWRPMSTASFTKYTATVVVPAGMTRCCVHFRSETTNASNGSIWIDSTTTAVEAPSVDPTPTGSILRWAGSVVPSGYLLCDGSTKNVADYPSLAAVLGTTYGGTAGSTFSLPLMDSDEGRSTGWITPTLAGTWVNYGSPYGTVAYKRSGNTVKLRGLVKSGAATSTIFTLPVGFRIPASQLFPGIAPSLTTGAASTGTVHTHPVGSPGVRINVNADGTVAHSVGDTAYLDLSSIWFETADAFPGGGTVVSIIKT